MSNWFWNFFFIFLNNSRKSLLKEKEFYTEKNHWQKTGWSQMDVTYEDSGKKWYQIADITACSRTCCRSVRFFNQMDWLPAGSRTLVWQKRRLRANHRDHFGIEAYCIWKAQSHALHHQVPAKEPASPFPDSKGGILALFRMYLRFDFITAHHQNNININLHSTTFFCQTTIVWVAFSSYYCNVFLKALRTSQSCLQCFEAKTFM